MTFFKVKRRNDLLKVDKKTFATLKKVGPHGDVTFEIRYIVDQLKLIQLGLKDVDITIKSNVSNQKAVLKTTNLGSLDSNVMINDIRTRSQTLKQLDKQRDVNVVVKKRSDTSSKINNELVTAMRNKGINVDDMLRKSVLVPTIANDIKERNEVKPILNFVAHENVTDLVINSSSSLRFFEQDLMIEMIMRQGIDPSYVTKLTDRSMDAKNSFEGTLRSTKTREQDIDPVNLLLNRLIFGRSIFRPSLTSDVDDDVTFLSQQQVVSSEVKVVETIKILGRTLKLMKNGMIFNVSFDLIDPASGSSVCSVTCSLDVGEHLKFYNTPKKPPVVSTSIVDLSTRASLLVRQVDPGAKYVDVYKKMINTIDVSNDEYRLIETLRIFSGQSKTLNVDRSPSSVTLYRFVPVGDKGTTCAEFTNVIIRPNRFIQDSSISLITHVVETGVNVEINSFPPGLVSLEVLSRNLSTFEKTYRVVDDDVIVINDLLRSSGTFNVIDTFPSIGHVHEYVVRMHFRSGITLLSPSSVIERFLIENGKIDIDVTDVVIANDLNSPNVSFKVGIRTIDNEADVVRKLLRRQGISDFFVNQLENEKGLMKELVAFNVQRLNMTTGEREDFGVLTNDDFDDAKLRSNNSVKSLVYGMRYQYEISGLLRSAETLFETFVKNTDDKLTKRPFKVNPQKSFHPRALVDGIITSPEGLRTLSKNSLSFGRTGSYKTVDVAFDTVKVDVLDLQADKFEDGINVISWNVDLALINKIDHFIIMKDVHGVRTIVGKSHGNFSFGRYKFFHELNSHDTGEMKYIVILIRNDYTMGNEVTSNAVIV